MTQEQLFDAILSQIKSNNKKYKRTPNYVVADKYINKASKNELIKIVTDESMQLNEIYNIIAKVSKDTLRNYNIEKKKKNTNFEAVPMTLRKIVYFVIFKRCFNRFGLSQQTPIGNIRATGYIKDTIEGINDILKSSNSSIEYKSEWFQSDKWDLEVFKDFSKFQGIYIAPDINIYYDGRKKCVLGFMISELANQVNYKTFIDIFGGSGEALLNVSPRNNVIEYINDFDPLNCNYFNCIKNNFTDFINGCNNIVSDIESQSNTVIFQTGHQSVLNKKNSIGTFSNEYIYAHGLYDYFSKNAITDKKMLSDSNKIEQAVGFYYLHSFGFQGHPSKSGITEETLSDFLKIDFNKQFSDYQRRFKNVNIVNEDAINLLLDPNINKSDTLCYLDSPYIATKGYRIGFNRVHMNRLIANLARYNGKFIFSCRAAMSMSSSIKKINDDLFSDVEFGGVGAYDYYLQKLKEDAIDSINAEAEVRNFFCDFQSAFQGKKDMFVLFGGKDVPINSEDIIWENINRNNVFEIMIVNFDFDVPDINKYWNKLYFQGKRDSSKINKFYKEDFNSFCDKVIKYLKWDNIE